MWQSGHPPLQGATEKPLDRNENLHQNKCILEGGEDMIKWRPGVDVLQMLAKSGYTAYSIRQEGIMGQSELQRIRRGGLPSWKTLDWICNALYVDVGELVMFVRDGEQTSPGEKERGTET